MERHAFITLGVAQIYLPAADSLLFGYRRGGITEKGKGRGKFLHPPGK